jgi:hypothetical protein
LDQEFSDFPETEKEIRQFLPGETMPEKVLKSATQQAIEWVEKQNASAQMICAHCAEHWLSHSFEGDYCPDTNGIRRSPKTTYLEAPAVIQ